MCPNVKERMNVEMLVSCIKGGDIRGRAGWLIQFRYDVDFVERFKRVVDYRHREWRPDTKTWWVDEVYEAELDQLFPNWYALARLQGTLL